MELVDQLGYEMLSLLFDSGAPLSVVFPESRHFLAATKAVEPRDAIEWITEAARRGLVTVHTCELDGSDRDVTSNDVQVIAAEYESGKRGRDEIRQILDRIDLWLTITEAGRAEVKRIWPEMPPEA